ncbi:MAG: hypothetical protein V1897_04030 [Pseudomonadota bacterium]
MKPTILLLFLFCGVFLLLAQEKPIRLSKPKVEARMELLKNEHRELQKLVDDPTLAVPSWKARMRQIEGLVGAFEQSLNDSTLFWIEPKDSLSNRSARK